MSETYQENQDSAPIEALREQIGILLTDRDVEHYGVLREAFGHMPFWVDDPTGHYPISRHRVHDLRIVVGQVGIVGAYFQAPPHDPHHPGPRFTLRPGNLHAISQVLSDEVDMRLE